MTRRVITYGLDAADADLRGTGVVQDGGAWACQVVPGAGLKDAAGLGAEPASPLCTLRLPIPGRHNLQNALAALETQGEEARRFIEIVQTYAGPPGPGREPREAK